MFDGLASFKEENARDWLKGRLYGFDEKKLEVKRMACTVKCLDDYSLKPFFIKIDVQGFEYEVLLGAQSTLLNARPILLIETPGSREQALLTKSGYQPFVFKERKLLPGIKNFNVFFFPEEIVSSITQAMQDRTLKKVA
jgi:hypothetical protein